MGVPRSKLSNYTGDWQQLERAPVHPGVYVQEGILDAYPLTQQQLADAVGVSRLTINEIVRGKRNLTESTALRFAKLTGTTVEMWLDLQRTYSLWKTSRDEAKALAAIKPLKPRRTRLVPSRSVKS